VDCDFETLFSLISIRIPALFSAMFARQSIDAFFFYFASIIVLSDGCSFSVTSCETPPFHHPPTFTLQPHCIFISKTLSAVAAPCGFRPTPAPFFFTLPQSTCFVVSFFVPFSRKIFSLTPLNRHVRFPPCDPCLLLYGDVVPPTCSSSFVVFTPKLR